MAAERTDAFRPAEAAPRTSWPVQLLRRWRVQAYLDFMFMTRDFRFFLIDILSDVILSFSGVMAVFLLAERFDGIGIWSRDQVVFMLGYAALVSGVLDFAFGYNVLHISRRVGRGQLDHTLMRYVRRIGVVFGQRTELWWDQPVAASFEWKRFVWDIPRDRYEAMLGFVKELLGLGEFYHTLARQLSLGQKMRADLALMLMHEPEILFLDEPTIGVDVLAKRHILEFIKQLNRERGVTVMLTSHDMDDLEQLAGRIVMIDRGHIAFDGDFRQLRRAFGDRRHLTLETSDPTAPGLDGAEWVHSDGTIHTFTFDAERTPIAELLERAAAQTRIVDVETHRAPIDDVIADVYQSWQSEA